MPETDESNYSGRQTALLQQDRQELRDASSSLVLINIIHLTFKREVQMASRLDGATEDGEGCDDEDVRDGLPHVNLMLVCLTDRMFVVVMK